MNFAREKVTSLTNKVAVTRFTNVNAMFKTIYRDTCTNVLKIMFTGRFLEHVNV